MNLAERLRVILDKSGRPQKDIAAAAELAPATLSQYKSGERSPGAVELWRLSQALGVPIEWFFMEPSAAEKLRERAAESDAEIWRRRAKAAEAKLEELKTDLRAVLDRATLLQPQAPTGPAKGVSAEAGEFIAEAEKVAASERGRPHRRRTSQSSGKDSLRKATEILKKYHPVPGAGDPQKGQP